MNHLAPLPLFAVLLTNGLAWDPGVPGAFPKCFCASLTLGPLNRTVPDPIIIDSVIGHTSGVLLGQLVESEYFSSCS